MPRKQRLDEDVYYPNGLRYNLKYKAGVVCPRVPERYFQGMDPAVIEWVWICEQNRHATAGEIAKLCRGK